MESQNVGALYFITGSSGSGKTTLLRAVARIVHPTITARHIDDFGVPSQAELQRAGGGWAWQAGAVRAWAVRARRERAFFVVEGQARPSDVLDAAKAAGLASVHVTLVDCEESERRRRLLTLRDQADLDTLDTYAWAAYLRGQADALSLEVIDTTSADPATSARALAASITRFAAALR